MAVNGTLNLTIGSVNVIDANSNRIIDANGDYITFGSSLLQTAAGTVEIGAADSNGSVSETLLNFTQSSAGWLSIGGAIGGTTTATLDNITLAATGPPITNLIAPYISGLGWFGSALWCTPGSWSSSVPVTISYQWRRYELNISGATSNAYTVSNDDAGTLISCAVTGSNSLGTVTHYTNTITINSLRHKRRARYRKVVAMRLGGTTVFNSTNEE